MELWSSTHAITLLPALAVMILIGVVLRKTIGKKEHRIRMIPFQILACIIFALEVGKQVVSLRQGYDLYHLPFHFCSLFIFALPLMSFYRGKHKNTVYAVTSGICSALSLLLLIYPCLIYSADNIRLFFKDFLSLHTVAFHNIVLFEFVLIVALDLHTPAPKGEAKATALFTMGFTAVAATMAQLLKTNYANFYRCNIPFFESLRAQVQTVLGATLTQIIYVLIVAALTVGFTVGAYWFYRLIKHITAKKSTC